MESVEQKQSVPSKTNKFPQTRSASPQIPRQHWGAASLSAVLHRHWRFSSKDKQYHITLPSGQASGRYEASYHGSWFFRDHIRGAVDQQRHPGGYGGRLGWACESFKWKRRNGYRPFAIDPKDQSFGQKNNRYITPMYDVQTSSIPNLLFKYCLVCGRGMMPKKRPAEKILSEPWIIIWRFRSDRTLRDHWKSLVIVSCWAKRSIF